MSRRTLNGIGYYSITDDVWNTNDRLWKLTNKDQFLNQIHWREDEYCGWECCPQYLKLFPSDDGLKYPFIFRPPNRNWRRK